jgi:sulfur-carrier protein
MDILLLAFGNSSDGFGFSKKVVSCEPEDTPRSIAGRIAPQVGTEFLRVALDGEFSTWDTPVGDARELAFLPPVSGG